MKITDFGIAQLCSKTKHHEGIQSQYGSLAFMAPERLRGEIPTQLSDWFSFGVLAFELLSSFHPFGYGATSNKQISQNIQTKTPEPAEVILPTLPLPLAQLLNQLIAPNPKDRPKETEYIALRLKQVYNAHVLQQTESSETKTVPIAIPSRNRKNKYLKTTFACLIAFLLATSTYYYWHHIKNNKDYYIAVLRPTLKNAPEQLTEQHELLLATIDDTVRRSIINHPRLKLIAYSEVEAVKESISTVGNVTNADKIISTTLACSTTSCDIDFSLASPSFKDKEVVWAVTERKKWTSLLERYSDITQTAEAHLKDVFSDVTHEQENILPLSERHYRQYLSIYKQVIFSGAYSEQLLEEVEELIQKRPAFAPSYHLLMDIVERLYVEKKDKNILKRIEKSIAYASVKHKSSVEFLTHMFHVFLNTNQLKKAHKQLSDLSQLAIAEGQYKQLEASYLLSTNNYPEAIASYKEAIAFRPTKTLLHNLALAHWWNNEIPQAEVLLKKVLALSPDDYEATQLLATAYLAKGDTASTIQKYQKLLTLNASSMEMSNLALAYMLEGDYEQSYLYAKQAVEKSPKNPLLKLNLADAQKLRQRDEDATQLYQQVIDSYSNEEKDLNSWLSSAQAYAHTGNYSKAINALNNARKASPNNAEVAYISSIVLTLAGEYLSAINQADNALKDGIGVIWFNLPWFEPLCSFHEFKKLFSERGKTQQCE